MRERNGKVGSRTMIDAANEVAPPVPGRQSLVQRSIAPVPADAPPAREPAELSQPLAQLPHYSSIQRIFGGPQARAAAPDVHAAAAQGISGSAGQLPHLEQIQRSFGKHDVSHVQAHTGSEAAAGAKAMGADAFATGDHVAFAGPPSLHIAAHEAAHVVQQRGGVQLAGGVGAVGDTYEQHADQVADLVVQGKSAEALLDEHAGGGAASAPGVQRELEGSSKRKEWPGGPTVARKSAMHTLTEYVDWLRQVEAKYGASRAETLQRLRRLYYSDYTGGAGPGFDKLIRNEPGAGGPPMTTSDLPLAVINSLYETNAIVTPNGSQVDISHILADLDMHVAGGGIKAGAAEVRFGVNFEGVFTRVAEHPLTVALASDAPAKIREHLANTARMFVDDNPLHGTPADLTTYGPLLDEVATRFLHFLTTGLATGDAPWP